MPVSNKVKPALYETPVSDGLVLKQDVLVRQAQAGSAEAVGELYLTHHQHVYRFIWSRVADRHLAEDLTMEVFVRMLKNLSSYEDRSLPFRAWLYSIARNLVIDLHRKNGKYHNLPIEEMNEVELLGETVEEMTDQKLKLSQVRQLLAKIDPDEREVIELRFLAGLSLQETAAAVEKTIPAVKALQHRGLASLKMMLR